MENIVMQVLAMFGNLEKLDWRWTERMLPSRIFSPQELIHFDLEDDSAREPMALIGEEPWLLAARGPHGPWAELDSYENPRPLSLAPGVPVWRAE